MKTILLLALFLSSAISADITVDDLLQHLDIHKYTLVIEKETDIDYGFYNTTGALESSGGGCRLRPGKYSVLISENGNIWSITFILDKPTSLAKGIDPGIKGHLCWRSVDNIVLNEWIVKICPGNNGVNDDAKIRVGEVGFIIKTEGK